MASNWIAPDYSPSSTYSKVTDLLHAALVSPKGVVDVLGPSNGGSSEREQDLTAFLRDFHAALD